MTVYAGDSLHTNRRTQVKRQVTVNRTSAFAVLFSVLGVVIAWTAQRAPTAAKRASRAVLTLAGYGCVCVAAWQVAMPLGLLAIGLACLLLEMQINSPGQGDRQ